MLRNPVVCLVVRCAITTFALLMADGAYGYVYSSERYAFEPRGLEVKEGGVEFYMTDLKGGNFTGLAGCVPVYFCKFGNMIASNISGFEKPQLWKDGNKVVVQTGYAGDSPQRAQGEVQIVVMDADAGELSVARPSEEDLEALNGADRIEVENHAISCYDGVRGCHRIPVEAKHKFGIVSRIQNRRAISAAAKRCCAPKDLGEKWIDPKTGLEWLYAEIKGGVEIVNKRTGGWAVSPTQSDVLEIPEHIAGKPVISIGGGAIVSRFIKTIHIPKTVERFGACGPTFSLDNMMLRWVDVDDGNKAFCSRGGLLYDSTASVLLFVPRAASEVVIPEGVSTIAQFAFRGCYSLNRVTIPSSVKELGEGVFMDSDLEEVRFLGDAPKVSCKKGPYFLTSPQLTTRARKDAVGWRGNGELPTMWCDRPIVFE